MKTMLIGYTTPVYFALKGGGEKSEKLLVKCPRGIAFGGAAVKTVLRGYNNGPGAGISLKIRGNKSSNEFPQQWSLPELKDGLLISPVLDGSSEFLMTSLPTGGLEAARLRSLL